MKPVSRGKFYCFLLKLIAVSRNCIEGKAFELPEKNLEITSEARTLAANKTATYGLSVKKSRCVPRLGARVCTTLGCFAPETRSDCCAPLDQRRGKEEVSLDAWERGGKRLSSNKKKKGPLLLSRLLKIPSAARSPLCSSLYIQRRQSRRGGKRVTKQPDGDGTLFPSKGPVDNDSSRRGKGRKSGGGVNGLCKRGGKSGPARRGTRGEIR